MTSHTEPGRFTDPGRHANLFQGLPTSVPELSRVIHGVGVHEFMAADYGAVWADEDRQRMVNHRPVSAMLDEIVALSSEPLTVPRSPSSRIATNCRGFTVLLVSMLRAQGTPARARCGFGAYFKPGFFEDHWVAEWWDSADGRWKLADAQIDEKQRGWFTIDFDLYDIPPGKFPVAGLAWQWVRAGKEDPAKFGLSVINEAGAWWIAANMIRDAAALLDVEVLPWDLWGSMPEPEDTIDDDLTALFDRLAEATVSGSTSDVQEIMRDQRVAVPREVFNFQHKQLEPIDLTLLT